MTTPLAEGKTKILHAGERPDELRVTFKDMATAFNGVKIEQVPGKGALNAEISAILFELLAARGIETCFVSRGAGPAELIYRKLQMIPLEVVVRNHAYGSVCKRFGFEAGMPFQKPLLEFFLKNDAMNDPQISEGLIEELKLLPAGLSVEALTSRALAINEILVDYFAARGIRCADYKLEFGVDSEGRLVLGDEMSPDNFRLRDIETGQVLDKDVFRQDLGDLTETYTTLLKRLQQAGPGVAPRASEGPLRSYRAAIRVKSRKNILNPESRTILEALHSLGYAEVSKLQAGRLFELTLEAPSLIAAQQRVENMAESLLSNPVIEDYELTLAPAAAAAERPMAEVTA